MTNPNDEGRSAPDLLAQVKSRLDLVRKHMSAHWGEQCGELNCAVDPLMNDAGELGAAVQAVLELHAPEAHPLAPEDVKCKGCATHVTFTEWPCPTVKAVAAKLLAEVSA